MQNVVQQPLMQKSQGIAPRLKLTINDPSRGQTSVPFTDHTGRNAISTYYGHRPVPDVNTPVLPPLWAFQYYVTYRGAIESSSELAEQLLKATRSSSVCLHPVRLDVHFLPGASVEDCIAHYRAEKVARGDVEPALRMLDPYIDAYGRVSVLVVIPDSAWKTNGATVVSFDFTSDMLYAEDEREMKEAHFNQVSIEHGVAWQRPASDPQEGMLVGEWLHELREDELQDVYEMRIEQGYSDWDRCHWQLTDTWID